MLSKIKESRKLYIPVLSRERENESIKCDMLKNWIGQKLILKYLYKQKRKTVED